MLESHGMWTIAYLLSLVMLCGLLACGSELDAPQSMSDANLMDDPLWYRTLTDEGAILAAQKRLDLMTSTSIQANRAGPVKDEIALLCRYPGVVDLIVETFRRRKGSSNAQMSAYMEIFGRIRHPKFAELMAEGLSGNRQETLMNAIEAAVVQRSPVIVPILLESFEKQEAYGGLKILSALIAIDSSAARRAVCNAVDHSDDDIAVMALSAVGGMRLTGAIPLVEKRLKDGPDQIRVMAAWCLARMGQSRGARRLLAFALNGAFDANSRAQALQNLTLLQWWEGVDDVRGLLSNPIIEVALESRVYLATARDRDLLASLDEAIQGNDLSLRDLALRVVARTGSTADLERVLEHESMLTSRELLLLARALQMERPAGSVDFITRLIHERKDLRGNLISILAKFGSAGLRSLEDIMNEDSGEDHGWTMNLIGAVGSAVDPRAQEVLQRFDMTTNRRVWRFARENIRLIEQRLLKSAPAPYQRPSGSQSLRSTK